MKAIPGRRNLFNRIGGKFYLAEWIISHFLEHRIYVEMFGGAAHVLLKKPLSKVEVYNDLDQSVVNAILVSLKQPNRMKEWLAHLPYARSLHDRMLMEWKQGDSGDAFTKAARFLYLNASSVSSVIGNNWSYGRDRSAAEKLRHRSNVVHDFVSRFKLVQIECADWREMVRRYDSPHTLFYADPPYMNVDSKTKQSYQPFSLDHHNELFKTLRSAKGHALVSFYKSRGMTLQGYRVLSRDYGTCSRVVSSEHRLNPVSTRASDRHIEYLAIKEAK